MLRARPERPVNHICRLPQFSRGLADVSVSISVNVLAGGVPSWQVGNLEVDDLYGGSEQRKEKGDLPGA